MVGRGGIYGDLHGDGTPVGADDDCEDQGMMKTDTCVKFQCQHARLVKRGHYWCCPACGDSYGEDAR